MVGAPPLAKPYFGTIQAQIVEREEIPARQIVRFRLALDPGSDLPERVRVNLRYDLDDPALRPGAVVRAKVRLMPPAVQALPGSYNFARAAWFDGLGASGTTLERPVVVQRASGRDMVGEARAAMSRHIRERLPGGAGAIAATLATGDRGAISEEDAEAMRNSGLAHLLSISGLHVSAVIAAAALATLKLLALSPPLARRFRLPLAAALAGAAVGIAYTVFTGGEVPTIRACVAAMLVLLALALGRDPVSMRLIAAGAMLVLLLWPEVLVGPSFQLSFAAVAAIVALHDHPRMRQWSGRQELGMAGRLLRVGGMLLLTGLIVEVALMPIALFHFHKAGVYGALANLVAIPLTTFVIMPLEALALLLDLFGLGAPVWWLCGVSLDALLGLAHAVSSSPGAVNRLPSMGNGLFALFVLGGLWLLLWRSRRRYWGLVPLAIASIGVALRPVPDLMVTSDGRDVAVRGADGELILLREARSGYRRDLLTETAGFEGEPIAIDAWPRARCSADFCSFVLQGRSGPARILVSRSRDYVPERALAAACRRSDIVISDRYLPYSCRPAWLRIDRNMLARTGGLAIRLDPPGIDTVAAGNRGHGWYERPR